MKKRNILVSMMIAGGLITPAAYATDGYFSHGYGIKSEGMGGVGIAFPQDAIAAATNPAGMVMVGDRIDFGVDWFRPSRSAEIVGNGAGLNQSLNGNGKQNFFIPSFGYNRMMNPNYSLGVSVYGNGGMNTTYTTPVNAFGSTNAGIDMSQLIVAPTWSMKLNPANTVGVSLNLAYQSFAASGAQNFNNTFYTSSPGSVTDLGHDHSTGYGLRLGWIGQVTDMVSLGATYQTKTKMSKFNTYQGFFANQGEFDIPANYGVGIAVKTTPALTVAADIERILFSGVSSVGNTLVPALGTPGSLLGSAAGSGFGWTNQTVYKLGVNYKYQPNIVLRAGFNYGKTPIPASQTFFNIFAPATVEKHVTLGATWTLADKSEVSVAYMHAFTNTINGSGSIPNNCPGPQCFGGGEANLTMHEDSLGISYGW